MKRHTLKQRDIGVDNGKVFSNPSEFAVTALTNGLAHMSADCVQIRLRMTPSAADPGSPGGTLMVNFGINDDRSVLASDLATIMLSTTTVAFDCG